MSIMTQIRHTNLKTIASNYSSQSELANALDVTTARVSHLLSGYRNIGEKTARKIEEKLRLKHGALDNDAENNNNNINQMTAQPLSVIQSQLINAFEQLPMTEQQKVIQDIKKKASYFKAIYEEMQAKGNE